MRPALPTNQWLRGKTITDLAREQGKGIVAAFLDLRTQWTGWLRRCSGVGPNSS